MIAAIDPTLGVLVAGAISALGAYLVAARKMSGAVRSSDAEQLWAESRSIREWSADRIAALTGQIASLESRIDELDARKKELQTENERLLEVIDELRHNYIQCRSECDALTAQRDQALHELRGIDTRKHREETNGPREGKPNGGEDPEVT